MKTLFLALLAGVLLQACSRRPVPGVGPVLDTAAILGMGDSIAAQAQQALLQNLSTAMQTGGPEFAVDYCSTQAITITDSVAGRHGVVLRRISGRNRNPGNGLLTDMDQRAWLRAADDREPFVQVDDDGTAWYYKPITLGMPTCLKCHGRREDITEATRVVIEERYPQDKATGHALGDLRGLWKMGFMAGE